MEIATCAGRRVGLSRQSRQNAEGAIGDQENVPDATAVLHGDVAAAEFAAREHLSEGLKVSGTACCHPSRAHCR